MIQNKFCMELAMTILFSGVSFRGIFIILQFLLIFWKNWCYLLIFITFLWVDNVIANALDNYLILLIAKFRYIIINSSIKHIKIQIKRQNECIRNGFDMLYIRNLFSTWRSYLISTMVSWTITIAYINDWQPYICICIYFYMYISL